MSILTTSQLTFCDLKDSYSIYLDTDCIGVACDKDGNVIADQIVAINYGGYMGSDRVGLNCNVNSLPIGIEETSKTPATSENDGVIELKITQGTNLGNSSSLSAKITFETTENSLEKFIFEKYISFVKYMVGADGQAGIDAISFQIYSTDGYEFSEEITNIQLQTIAFYGDSVLTTDSATYQWYRYTPGAIDQESGNSVDWTEISGEASDKLSVSKYDLEKLPITIRCKMTIGDNANEYEAYVCLTSRVENYTSRISFFDGSGVFDSNNYLVAYVELYKNNQLVDGLRTTNYYYSDYNSVFENSITTDMSVDNVSIEDMCYFIYKTTVEENIEQTGTVVREIYKVVLGKCSSITIDENGTENGVWELVNFDHKYTYNNNIDVNSNLNVVAISRNDVNKTKDVNFEAYNADSMLVSYASTMVFDLKDPIVSNSEPYNPMFGQLWLDTSKTPYILKIYTEDSGWQYFEQQKGNRVFASANPPEDFVEGDLWILHADYEVNGIQYGEGSMLQAVSYENDNGDLVLTWVDVMSNDNNIFKNIKESFMWDNTGVSIAQKVTNSDGTITTPFYVHINSQRMGFYSVSYDENNKRIDETEVVHIGNKSATIKNATFEGDGDTVVNNDIKFNKDVYFGNFVWTVRSNGNYGLYWKEGEA